MTTKTALVIGATGGIGKPVARLLAARGWADDRRMAAPDAFLERRNIDFDDFPDVADVNFLAGIFLVAEPELAAFKNVRSGKTHGLAAERIEGKNSRDSIFEACLLRFRPILMTTMAALFGALPLAFGTGTGSELRRPLGISIVGGLIVSQLLTLYTTPVVYLFMDRLRLRVMGREHDTFSPATEEGTV